MTDLLTIAKECGAAVYTTQDHGTVAEFASEQLAAYTERIRKDQRERCAALISTGDFCRMAEHMGGYCDCAEMAAAIREGQP